MSDFKKFVNRVKQEGVARANKYRVLLTPPLGLIQPYKLSDLSLYCSSAVMPGIKIETATLNDSVGEPRTVPHNRSFEEAVFVFYVDDGYITREIFEKWVDAIIDPTTKAISYYDDFIGIIDVYSLKQSGDTSYHLTLHDAYPSMIEGIEYDAESGDIVKLKVTFVYKNYTRNA